MKKAIGICAIAILGGLVACNKENNNNVRQGRKVTVEVRLEDEGEQTRAVSFGNDGATSNSTFQPGDKIYVFNNENGQLDAEGLSVTDISADGKTATFTGSLCNTYSVGDRITLFYNVPILLRESPEMGLYDYYNTQSGKASTASAFDYAMCTTSVAESDLEIIFSGAISLQKMQSMFRQRLSFEDKDGNAIPTPNIRYFEVSTGNGSLDSRYWLNNTSLRSSVCILDPSFDSNGDLYFALRFNDASASDGPIMLSAIDNEKNRYVGIKSAPANGFKNGNYYHGDMTLTWNSEADLPHVSITRLDGGTVPSPNGLTYAIAENEGKPVEMTMSNNNVDYTVYMLGSHGATIYLNELRSVLQNCTIASIYSNADVTLYLEGNNYITTTHNSCIFAGGTLKIKGNGTLTVTTTNGTRRGIVGSNYDSNSPVSNLEEGYYEVTCSNRIDNGDGTYTWTYTVQSIG